jgi:methylase of polypeptide subunit release factors
VVNLCCGVGSDAIKIANVCGKVFAWDSKMNNIECMKINTKIYGVDNIKIINNKL